MESDRLVCLTTQAAARGLVDFRTLDLEEPANSLKLRVLLDELAAENERQIRQSRLQFYLSVYQSLPADSEGREPLHEVIVNDLHRIEDSLQPWAAKERTASEVRQVNTLRDAWERAYGKLDDPETQRGIRETVEALKKDRQERKAQRERLAKARQKILDMEQDRREQQRLQQRRRKH